MADTITLNAGVGGAVLNTDDIGGVHTQIVKVGFGALDSLTLVASGAGLPVIAQASTNTQEVVGDVAQDAAIGGNPVSVGARASAAAPTDMSADGDSVYLWATLKGALNIADAGGSITVDNGGTFAVQATNGGTFAVQVDGAALTALQLIDDVVYAEDIAAQAADKGISVLAVRRDTASALAGTDNDYIQLTTNATGHLWVSSVIASGGIASGAVASGAVASGAFASGSIASGALASGSIAAGAIADLLVDDAAFGVATSKVWTSGFLADEASTDSVDEGDVGAARMTLDRRVYTVPSAHTQGGATPFYNLDCDETEDAIKATAGQLYDLVCMNLTTSLLYVKLYNATTANVTVGSTTPLRTIPVPGNNDSDGAGVAMTWPVGLKFDTAITIACTTGFADNDTGAPAGNAMICHGSYL